jgi:hypothetical protein
MDLEKHIQELDALQAKQNSGRGISCVQDIIAYLKARRFEEALAIRQWDGDKTRSYPEVEDKLYEIFGCRTHGVHGCTQFLCNL